MSVATFVYLLCLLSALACTVMLLRAYRHNRTRLLLWTGLGFGALTVSNLFLVCDLVIWPDIDFWGLRQAAALSAIGIFIYGFLWEAER